jgi:hypothetical protein
MRQSQLEFGDKIIESFRWMRFCKGVSQLIFRGDRMKMQNTMLKMMLDERTINLDMFGTFIEYIIMSNLYGTLIVTINERTSKLRNTHVKQKSS